VDVTFDAVHGIEYRVLPSVGRTGWMAQWRPSRALRAFPSFTYRTRSERFDSAEAARAFMRRNAGMIVSRAM
jgi:hypothetical protein